MVIFDHVSFSYGEKSILKDFSYTFATGITAVNGPSGAGKTTLLRLILGELKPDSGSVLRTFSDSRNAGSGDPGKLNPQTEEAAGYLNTLTKEGAGALFSVSFQEPRLLPWLTVRENVALVLKKDHKKEANRYLSMVHLSNDENTLPGALSGGMQKRVSLARALAYMELENAPLLILDEPFSGLDPALHAEMLALVKDRAAGRTVILITHDTEDVASCDRVLTIDSLRDL